jgi:hypothetical protein
MTAFMAECFWPGVTEQQLAEAGARARRATEAITAGGVSARYVGSILVPADEIALCLFEAASIEAASDLNRRAAIPFERILEVVRLGPGRPPGRSPGALEPSDNSLKESR